MTIARPDEIRTCPACGLAAFRLPDQDTDTALAFQCQDRHPVFSMPRADEAAETPPRVAVVAVQDETTVQDASDPAHD